LSGLPNQSISGFSFFDKQTDHNPTVIRLPRRSKEQARTAAVQSPYPPNSSARSRLVYGDRDGLRAAIHPPCPSPRLLEILTDGREPGRGNSCMTRAFLANLGGSLTEMDSIGRGYEFSTAFLLLLTSFLFLRREGRTSCTVDSLTKKVLRHFEIRKVHGAVYVRSPVLLINALRIYTVSGCISEVKYSRPAKNHQREFTRNLSRLIAK
jgi:hypothetical protein